MREEVKLGPNSGALRILIIKLSTYFFRKIDEMNFSCMESRNWNFFQHRSEKRQEIAIVVSLSILSCVSEKMLYLA